MKISSKDIKNLQRSSDLLEIYSRDREEYDLKEAREAKDYLCSWTNLLQRL